MESELVEADKKGRILLKGAKKGEKYLVIRHADGWLVKPVGFEGSIVSEWAARASILEIFYEESKTW